jgi:hypothetical protein
LYTGKVGILVGFLGGIGGYRADFFVSKTQFHQELQQNITKKSVKIGEAYFLNAKPEAMIVQKV